MTNLICIYANPTDNISPSMGKSPSPLLSTASSLDPSPSPLSPAPSGYASTTDAYSSLFLRVNHSIASSSMKTLLKDLSSVLDLSALNFHEEKDSLYEFKYPHECGPRIFPLSYEQERKLLGIGVQLLDCEIYEFHLAFESPRNVVGEHVHDVKMSECF